MNQKRKFSISFIIISVLFISLSSCTTTNPPINTGIKTPGTLAVSTVTSTAGGPFAPAHVMAIWIEDNSGKFVKTLLAKGQTRRQYLANWLNATPSANTVDASTGATLTSHGTITCNWNGTDVSGAVVSNGTYKVCIELTDKDASGNFSTFTFAKDTVANSQSPANKPSFSSISLKWTPQ